jgi:hypothetical protein
MSDTGHTVPGTTPLRRHHHRGQRRWPPSEPGRVRRSAVMMARTRRPARGTTIAPTPMYLVAGSAARVSALNPNEEARRRVVRCLYLLMPVLSGPRPVTCMYVKIDWRARHSAQVERRGTAVGIDCGKSRRPETFVNWRRRSRCYTSRFWSKCNFK